MKNSDRKFCCANKCNRTFTEPGIQCPECRALPEKKAATAYARRKAFEAELVRQLLLKRKD